MINLDLFIESYFESAGALSLLVSEIVFLLKIGKTPRVHKLIVDATSRIPIIYGDTCAQPAISSSAVAPSARLVILLTGSRAPQVVMCMRCCLTRQRILLFIRRRIIYLPTLCI